MKKVLSIVLTGALAASFVMSASAAEVIKIGGIGPTTGPAGIYGSSVQNAMEIAVDEVNVMGGDIQFELTFEVDMHDAETSVNAYNTLKDKGMQILGGTVTTSRYASRIPTRVLHLLIILHSRSLEPRSALSTTQLTHIRPVF